MLRRIAPADHRVDHVEADDVAVDVGVLREVEALAFVIGAHVVGVHHLHQIGLPHVRALEHLQVIVAAAEFVALRSSLALDGGDDAVDERRLLAAVGQQPRLAVRLGAVARVWLAAVVRVALHHDAAVFAVLGDHVRAGADRPGVHRHAELAHAGLRIERIGLPWHRRQEGHLHPVLPLRVLALEADAQQVLFGRRRSGQRPAAKVEEGLIGAGRIEPLAQLRVFGLDQFAVLLQADHEL